ncbi:unnamed protein product [Strongylus vulgaris]|uniref:Uncharacterized protein n=1 Tax=Strongylus vulgaris TaxID=40348 RepID=A0A3P7KQ70_STRVU|nr:unnamed protein product [Strongylus vulgaris]
MNFDRLTAEIKQKELLVDDLKEQLKSLQSASREKEELVRVEKLRFQEELELRQREIRDEYSEKLRKMTAELEHREKMVKECENRLNQLTHLHEKLMEEEQNMTQENAELIEKLQETSLKHKREMDEIIEQNNLDREDWENERKQLEKAKNALLANLRTDLAKAETETREAVAREDALRADLNDAKEEIKDLVHRLEKENRDRENEESRRKERDESRERARLGFAAEFEESQVKVLMIMFEIRRLMHEQMLLHFDPKYKKSNVMD